MPTVLIGADICPIEANLPLLQTGNARALLNDLQPEFERADLIIANLECPLIDHPSPIAKTGPTFGAPPESINGIKAIGVDVLCLANNHILDHGAAGLEKTLSVCAEAGIQTVGAGENIFAARRILVKKVGTTRVGILAVAEHEFSIASKTSYGANPIDLVDIVRNINENKSQFDYLLVLVHGSAEFHVPTPRTREICRFFVEIGADAVIVQHPHCLGGYEEYRGAHIVYGQGAFIMDEAIYRDMQSFHEGFLVDLSISEGGSSRMEIIPFVQSYPTPGARRMAPEREAAFRKVLAAKCSILEDDDLVEREWLKYCQNRRQSYMSAVLGHHKLLRKLDFRGFLTRVLHGSRSLLGVRNVINCETHREALQTLFNKGL